MTNSSRYQWLGDIPEEWDILKISHTTYVKGRIGWHGLNTEDFIDEGPFCVTGTDLKDGSVDWTTCYHVSKDRYNQDPFIQLREDDLLLTKDGTIGKCGIVLGLNGMATLNSGLFVIRPKKESYLTKYFYWIIQSRIFENFILLTKTGTTISHLYQNVFEGFRFPVPNIKIQKQIADFLDKETTRIDTLISKKQKQIELLKEKRQAIITKSVTKGLNENVKMKDSGVEWIGEIPEHWDCIKMKYISLEIGDGIHATPTYDINGKIFFVNGNNLGSDSLTFKENTNTINDEEYEKYKKPLLTCNTVFIALNGTYGKTSFFNGEKILLGKSAGYITLKEEENKEYIRYYLQSNIAKLIMDLSLSGTTIANLSLKTLNDFIVPFPYIEEQKDIVEYLNQEIGRIEELNIKIEKSIKLLKEYRSSLITHSVSGQIDISKYEVSK